MTVLLRIQQGDRVQHMDGRLGECTAVVATSTAGYPIAIVRWMNGGQDRVELGYLQKVPDFAIV